MHDSKVVEQYYNENAINEWERFERHPVEFAITKRLISRYLSPDVKTVLDIGGGPGRYAIWLAGQGYSVTLLDLSEANIAHARVMAAEAQVSIRDFIAANALELDRHVTKKYDLVLLMGPLYHLTAETDRALAVERALEALNPGGILVVSFISAYAPILDTFKKSPASIEGSVDEQCGYLKDGVNIVSEENPGFTNAYFMHPNSAQAFMGRFGLREEGYYVAESILGPFENSLKLLDKSAFDACIDLGMRFADDPNCRACGEHLLWVGRKG